MLTMNKRIVVIGSLNMDIVMKSSRMPLVGETIIGEDVLYLPGGKGANQAVGVHKLAGNVDLIGAVGEDEFANQIKKQLGKSGLHSDLIEVIPEVSTGIASIYTTNQDNCITVIPGANYHFKPNVISQKAKEYIKQADVILMQLEIPIETVKYVLNLAEEYHIKKILNPAPAQEIGQETIKQIDYLTPNETELEILLGRAINSDKELEIAMNDWQNKYHNTLVVTLGERGCGYLINGQLKIVSPHSVDVVDTTGAGDSFNAAFAFGIASNWSFRDVIAFAIKASSFSVTKYGAQNGMPYYEEIAEK